MRCRVTQVSRALGTRGLSIGRDPLQAGADHHGRRVANLDHLMQSRKFECVALALAEAVRILLGRAEQEKGPLFGIGRERSVMVVHQLKEGKLTPFARVADPRVRQKKSQSADQLNYRSAMTLPLCVPSRDLRR